jgi:lysophospholipase
MSDAAIVEVDGAPAPRGVHASWVQTNDGRRLRVLVWPAGDAGIIAPRGTVFVFGGRTEYAEKYFEVIGELIARGFAVATVDWRGQGLSTRALDDPRKGHVTDFSEFDEDIACFMREIAPDMPKPWVALAHSMGGNILMRALHDHADWFSAAVLSAPMLGLNLGSAMARRTIELVAKVGASIGLAGHYVPGGSSKANDEVPFTQNILTHDRARYARCQAQIRKEPKLGLGGSTYGWLAAGLRSIAKIMRPQYLAEIKTPLLIVGAADDRLIARPALVSAAAQVADGRFVLLAQSHHEILIETDAVRRQFWSAFDKFIERNLPS